MNWILLNLEKISIISWVNISKLTNINLLKLSVSYIAASSVLSNIIKNTDEICFLNEKCFDLSLPFNWIALFFGAVCYLFGFIVYHYSCPSFIKKYPNHYEFSKYSPMKLDIWAELEHMKRQIEGQHNKDRFADVYTNIYDSLQWYDELKNNESQKIAETQRGPVPTNLKFDSDEDCINNMVGELISDKSNFKACYETLIWSLELLNFKLAFVSTMYFLFSTSLLWALIGNLHNVIMFLFK